MTDSERIHSFLRQARSRALLETSIRTGGHACAILVLAFLALALAAAVTGPAVSWPYVAFATIAACVAGGIALGLVRPSRVLEQPSAIARLVGQRQPSLASDLLSAVELQTRPVGESDVSADMTGAFYATVAQATEPVVIEELIPLDGAVRAVSIAAVALLGLLVALLVFPSAVGRGLRTLFHTPTLFEGAQVIREPLVGDVRITYDFPAYTGLPRQVIEGSTGELHALRGTRVQMEMRPLRSARQAPGLVLIADPPLSVRGFTVNGRPLNGDPASANFLIKYFVYRAAPPEGIQVQIDLAASTPVHLRVLDSSDGLPGTHQPRPPNVMRAIVYWPYNETTVVGRDDLRPHHKPRGSAAEGQAAHGQTADGGHHHRRMRLGDRSRLLFAVWPGQDWQQDLYVHLRRLEVPSVQLPNRRRVLLLQAASHGSAL